MVNLRAPEQNPMLSKWNQQVEAAIAKGIGMSKIVLLVLSPANGAQSQQEFRLK